MRQVLNNGEEQRPIVDRYGTRARSLTHQHRTHQRHTRGQALANAPQQTRERSSIHPAHSITPSNGPSDLISSDPMLSVLIRSDLIRYDPIRSHPTISDPIRSDPMPATATCQATESGAMCSHKTDVAASPSLRQWFGVCALQQSRAKAADSLFDSVWAVLIAEGINSIPVAVWHAMLPCDTVHYTRSVMTGLTPAPSAGRSVHFKRSVMTLFSCDSACAHGRL